MNDEFKELRAHISVLREALERAALWIEASRYEGEWPDDPDWEDSEDAKMASDLRASLSSTSADSLERLRKLEAVAVAGKYHIAEMERGFWSSDGFNNLKTALSVLDSEAVKR